MNSKDSVFAVDADKCIGCGACQIACKDKNNLELGVNYRRVFTTETYDKQKLKVWHYTDSCYHCRDAACVKVCKFHAMYNTENGVVAFDEEKCVGCRACIAACPYHIPVYRQAVKKAGKCDACIDLLAMGRNPVCVDACPVHCLTFHLRDDNHNENRI